MRIRRGTLAARGTLIAIGAVIAIAASAVTAVAVRAGAAGGAAASQAAVGAGSVAGPRDTVTVVGEGTQNETPDNAEISLGVSVTRGNSGDALNAANTEMTALVKAIKAQGVQDVDIQTTGISINQQTPQYSPVVYQAGNSVSVKIHHLSNVGTVIAAAQRDVVVVDRVVDRPVPPRVAVAEIGLAGERAVGDVHQAVRHGDADLHALRLVPPLFLVRPPVAGADVLARSCDPVASRGVLLERETAESRNRFGRPRVIEVNRILASGAQRLREIDEHRVELARVLQRGIPEQDFIDLQIRVQIHLDARVVLQHPEADGVLAADELPRGIDADVEVIGEQVVVGAVLPVLAAQ